MKPFTYALALGLAAAQLVLPARAADITGAGATFPFPVYSKWAEAYRKETGTGLNYQSIGSGGGIKQIQAKTVDFGATDAPLKGAALEKDGLVQFPTVMGGVVTVVNIAGLEPGKLKLTGELIADIYAGKITKWSDPKIAQLNDLEPRACRRSTSCRRSPRTRSWRIGRSRQPSPPTPSAPPCCAASPQSASAAGARRPSLLRPRVPSRAPPSPRLRPLRPRAAPRRPRPRSTARRMATSTPRAAPRRSSRA